MIVDAFTYNGEDDLLAIRLELLNPFVDRFVIVEADKTFTGLSKPQKFNLNNFRSFSSKIKYYFIDNLSASPTSAWENERLQRDSLIEGLNDLADDDIFILSDVDEIPNPLAIAEFSSKKCILAELSQGLYFYYLNNRAYDKSGLPVKWIKSVIVKYGNFKRFYNSLEDLRMNRHYGPFRFFPKFLIKRGRVTIENGGWHFSYLMSPEQIIDKLKSFSHSEVNRPEIANIENIENSIRLGKDFWGHGHCFKLEKFMDFPDEILNMPEFKRWYFP